VIEAREWFCYCLGSLEKIPIYVFSTLELTYNLVILVK
jgi:hypothetical protein